MELHRTEPDFGLTLDELIESAHRVEQSGSWDDALARYRAAAQRIRAGEQPERGPRVFRWLGRVLFQRGDYDQAKEAFEASLVRAQELGSRGESASALNALAAIEQFRGRLDVAEAFYARASAMANEVGNIKLAAMIDQNLGTLINIRGDLGAALARYQDALDRFRTLKDDRAAALVLNNMGILRTAAKEYAAAELCFRSAYNLAEKLGDDITRARVESNRAELNLAKKDYNKARQCCMRAMEIFSRLGSESGLGGVYKLMGVVHRATGNPQLALVQLDLALQLAQVCDNPLLEAETESEKARVHLDLKRANLALQSLNRAQELFRQLNARREILDLERRLERLEAIYLRAAELAMEDAPARANGVGERPRTRVADLAVSLAKAVGCADVLWIKIAATLRDVGSRTLPSWIADASGMPASRRNAPSHNALGETLVRDLGFPPEVCALVRSQHERWDGTGVPDGLAGDAIPLGARILTIADVYDTITTPSSYKPPVSDRNALHLMKTEMAGLLDPALLASFAGVLGQEAP